MEKNIVILWIMMFFINKLTKGTQDGNIKWGTFKSKNYPLSACSYYIKRGENYLTLEAIRDGATLKFRHTLSICDDEFTKLYELSGTYVDVLYYAAMRQMYNIDGIMNNFVAGIM